MCHRLDGKHVTVDQLWSKGLALTWRDLSLADWSAVSHICIRSGTQVSAPLCLERDQLVSTASLEARSGTACVRSSVSEGPCLRQLFPRAALPCLLSSALELRYYPRPCLPVGAPPELVTPAPSPTRFGLCPARPVLL